MSVLRRGIGLALGVWALSSVGMAHAQENLDAGKTAAQLYASDCAICHKSPRGLSKVPGLLGLQSFLQEHYTASRESAARLAAYLKSIDTGPAPAMAAHRHKTHPAASAKGPNKPPHDHAAPKKKSGQKESKAS
jgi:mono/diheme cytochrome c family protein